MSLPGVYKTRKKDGSIYYRASITYQNKHISLGSFNSVVKANLAYEIATDILRFNQYKIDDYQKEPISLDREIPLYKPNILEKSDNSFDKRNFLEKSDNLIDKDVSFDKSNSSIDNTIFLKKSDNFFDELNFSDKNYNLIDKTTYFDKCISFDKWVTLHNLRDNGLYIKTPIYLKERYFIYYLDINTLLKFDIDDLFFYAHHKIQRRGGYLFVTDYGMQVNILSRYGIKNFAVKNRDYRFINGDETDFRYSNIEVINPYYGVEKSTVKGKVSYVSKIHINGDYIIGRYPSEIEAAIAYNKAVNCLKSKHLNKDFNENYIHEIGDIEYAMIYNKVRISKKIREFEL